MDIIEKLEPAVDSITTHTTEPDSANGPQCLDEHARLLALLDTRQSGAFNHDQRETFQTLREVSLHWRSKKKLNKAKLNSVY